MRKRLLLILHLLGMMTLACRFSASPTVEPVETPPAPDSVPPTSPATDAAPPTPGSYDWSALDTALESFVPSKVDGLTFLLAKDGKIIYKKALGNQTIESFLPIASSTKMPSAVVILTLVEDGLLDLDKPIGTYL